MCLHCSPLRHWLRPCCSSLFATVGSWLGVSVPAHAHGCAACMLCTREALRGFEPRLPDSESGVLTVTPQGPLMGETLVSVGTCAAGHAGLQDQSSKNHMWQVRIELTTLGLWDLRAANCAIATLCTVGCARTHVKLHGAARLASRRREGPARGQGGSNLGPAHAKQGA